MKVPTKECRYEVSYASSSLGAFRREGLAKASPTPVAEERESLARRVN
jgi:hypothetical protein